jgi:hypothetical protein
MVKISVVDGKMSEVKMGEQCKPSWEKGMNKQNILGFCTKESVIG